MINYIYAFISFSAVQISDIQIFICIAQLYTLFYSIVQTDESIVPILSLDNATQTEKELNR